MIHFWFYIGIVSAAVQIGSDALIEDNPRAYYSRLVNVRPADGETVNLNPPRFSWFYYPRVEEKLKRGETLAGNHIFTFQISANPDFGDPVVNVTTPYNFYNTLPVLRGSERWFWCVGYDVGTENEWWSSVYSFTIAPGAVEWKRSEFVSPLLKHPRILFNSQNIDEIR